MAASMQIGYVLLALLTLFMSPPALAQEALSGSFVDASTVVDGLAVDMRYFGDNNFVGTRIDGYEQPRCLLTRVAARALAAVQRDLAVRGFGLKVFDCYRPASAVDHFVRWARDIADEKRKREFYPDLAKRDLFKLGYVASRSGHSRGSTVDLTLIQRADGQEIDMGTPFDFFSPKSAPGSKNVSAEQRASRSILRETMRRRGFLPYDKEWWHFALANEPFPTSYFNVPVR
jgi:zinc D-Ala-D-Ala dipeptidase